MGPSGLVDFPAPPTNVSVTEPLSRAWEHTRRMLFPFDAGKWFTLGFVAWLATLGEGGGNVPSNLFDSGGRGSGIDPILQWVRDNLSLVITVTVVLAVISTALSVVILFVSSRAKFMFVDDIVHDRAWVEEPWRRYREVGNKLFWFRLILGFAALLLVGGAAALGIVLAWSDLKAGVFGPGAWTGILVGGGLLLLIVFPLGIVGFVLEDFLVPVMYLHGGGVGDAWRMARPTLRAQLGPVVLYYLMKILLGFGVAFVALVVTCLTCCIASLPYIGTVILLPVFVFMKAYNLMFVEQLGPEWKLFPTPEPEPWQSAFAPPS